MRLSGWKPLKESHQFARFREHRHCGSGDKMVLVRYVILQDLVTKASSNFMGESPSR